MRKIVPIFTGLTCSNVSWKRKSDAYCLLYFGTLTTFAVANVVYKQKDAHHLSTLEKWLFVDSLPSVYFQFLFCYSNSMMMIALCLDEGQHQSYFCRILRSQLLQFLGRISLSLYLTHVLVQFSIILVLYGIQQWTEDEVFRDVSKAKGQGLPVWALPIQVILSIFVATLSTLGIEEPIRRRLEMVIVQQKKISSGSR